MIELAFVLLRKQKMDKKRKQANLRKNKVGATSMEVEDTTKMIDHVCALLFITSYIFFNLIYWSYYLLC